MLFWQRRGGLRLGIFPVSARSTFFFFVFSLSHPLCFKIVIKMPRWRHFPHFHTRVQLCLLLLLFLLLLLLLQSLIIAVDAAAVVGASAVYAIVADACAVVAAAFVAGDVQKAFVGDLNYKVPIGHTRLAYYCRDIPDLSIFREKGPLPVLGDIRR